MGLFTGILALALFEVQGILDHECWDEKASEQGSGSESKLLYGMYIGCNLVQGFWYTGTYWGAGYTWTASAIVHLRIMSCSCLHMGVSNFTDTAHTSS